MPRRCLHLVQEAADQPSGLATAHSPRSRALEHELRNPFKEDAVVAALPVIAFHRHDEPALMAAE